MFLNSEQRKWWAEGMEGKERKATWSISLLVNFLRINAQEDCWPDSRGQGEGERGVPEGGEMYMFYPTVDHIAGKPKKFVWTTTTKVISVSQKESQWFWFLGYNIDQLVFQIWIKILTILKKKIEVQFSVIFKMKKTGKLKEKQKRVSITECFSSNIPNMFHIQF